MENKTWWNLKPTKKQLEYIEMNLDQVNMNNIKTRKQASDIISKIQPVFLDNDRMRDSDNE